MKLFAVVLIILSTSISSFAVINNSFFITTQNERLGTVDPDERLGTVDPDERLGTVDPDERLGTVDPDERLGTVDPDERIFRFKF